MKPATDSVPLNIEQAVRERYSAASRQVQPSLCCPVQYDPQYLAMLPEEILQRDYGCGDPSKYVRPGEAVLDLGCGGGKICFIASQVVGREGRVLGVDMNDDMLALARKHQREVVQRIGWDNVEFFKGRIQDLALDLEEFDHHLRQHPVGSFADWLRAQERADEVRRTRPMIAAASIDVIVSNCVLNLVRPDDRGQLFREMFRVLRPGGRAAISDIVSDQPVPQRLRDNPQLWSGCISGAFAEQEFFRAFEEAGFHGMHYLVYEREPWGVVEGIEFRSVTIAAYKGDCIAEDNHQQSIIDKGVMPLTRLPEKGCCGPSCHD